MVKNDEWIIRMAGEHAMIEPFEEKLVSGGVVSYGVSSYGYDMRVSNIFLTPVLDENSVIDPKSKEKIKYEEIITDCFTLQPGEFVLARSLEYFRIPRDVLTICTGKSTYARCGVIVNVTPFEPEWDGYVTISISNTAPAPVRIHANEGIAQIIFLGADSVCKTSYADRKGKYQSQTGIKTAEV